MDKNLILIGRKKKFMVKAVVDGLSNNGYNVISVEPTVTDVSHAPGDVLVYLLYLDDEIPEDLFVYLKDQRTDSDKQLFLMGDPEEIEEAKKLIPAANIAGTFERPFNVTSVSARLDEAFDEQARQMSMKKILVIDDDGTMLYSIQRILSSKYRVFIANSGMNGLTFLANNAVDLILLDYEMPVLSGPKVLEMLRSESTTSGIPVMFLTGKSDKESVMSVIALKPEKYLLKTLPAAELIKNIDEYFAGVR